LVAVVVPVIYLVGRVWAAVVPVVPAVAVLERVVVVPLAGPVHQIKVMLPVTPVAVQSMPLVAVAVPVRLALVEPEPLAGPVVRVHQTVLRAAQLLALVAVAVVLLEEQPEQVVAVVVVPEQPITQQGQQGQPIRVVVAVAVGTQVTPAAVAVLVVLE